MMCRSAFFVAIALVIGCVEEPNLLDGSIKSSHSLEFDTVELRFLTDQTVYQLSYFKLLDPENESVTLGTLARAAQAVGRQLRMELV